VSEAEAASALQFCYCFVTISGHIHFGLPFRTAVRYAVSRYAVSRRQANEGQDLEVDYVDYEVHYVRFGRGEKQLAS